jgi:hypothetical protein
MTMQDAPIADIKFLVVAMGAIPRDPLTESDLRKWAQAAAENPTKQAVGQARIGMYLSNLPTEEDAARTPAEEPAASPYVHQPLPGEPCPCESSRWFEDCHGADM